MPVENQDAPKNIVNVFKQEFHVLIYASVSNGTYTNIHSQNNESMTNKNIILQLKKGRSEISNKSAELCNN